MIRSFRHRGLQRLYRDDNPSGVEADLVDRIKDRLALLDVATRPEDLDRPALRLHELKGSREGTWAVKVNANWRMTFRFEADGVSDVNLEDYH
jgi:proteic killer suppression protein